MRPPTEKTSPITDQDEAQRFDLSSRILRVTLLIRYFARVHRARLSQFTDPMTGELQVPGGRLPLPRRLRLAPWTLVLAGIAVLLTLRT
jgi:hypothetical protein